jgi:hypothetical protein
MTERKFEAGRYRKQSSMFLDFDNGGYTNTFHVLDGDKDTGISVADTGHSAKPNSNKQTVVFNGDYPLLDISRQRFYRWLRQGGALLTAFCVVVGFWAGLNEPAIAVAPDLHSRAEALSGDLTKEVPKRNVAIYPQQCLAACDSLQINGIGPEILSNYITAFLRLDWRTKSEVVDTVDGIMRIQPQCVIHYKNQTILHDNRRGLAKVHQRYLYWPQHGHQQSLSTFFPKSNGGYFEARQRNAHGGVGGFFGSVGGLFSDGNLILSRFPQIVSGSPERPSEPSDSNGRERGQKPVVIVRKLSDPFDRVHQDMIAGAIFLAGLGIFGAYVCIDWMKRKEAENKESSNNRPNDTN